MSMATRWTDEMHASFLSMMEESFVERELMGKGGWPWWWEGDGQSLPRLFVGARPPSPSSVSSGLTEDGPLQDTAESATDFPRGRKRAATATTRPRDAVERRARKCTKTRRTPSCQRRRTGLSKEVDQVVPVFEERSSVAVAQVETSDSLDADSTDRPEELRAKE